VKAKISYIRRPGLRWGVQRLLLNSPWEDVAIEISDRVYSVDSETGVTRYSLDQFHLKYRNKTWTLVDIPDDCRTEYYLNDQLDKPMDSTALFPIYTFRRWTLNSQWYSTELVAKSLMFSNVLLYPALGRVTPRKLWSLLPTVVVTG
jgi:hypothetical protein